MNQNILLLKYYAGKGVIIEILLLVHTVGGILNCGERNF